MTGLAGTEWLLASPIVSDPTQFDSVADELAEKYDGVRGDVEAARDVLYEYIDSHDGDDIKTICRNGHRVALALRSLVACYSDVGDAFKTCASGLRDLEAELDDPGGLNSLKRRIDRGSFSGGGSDDSLDDVLADARAEFDRIQAAEVSLLDTLAGTILTVKMGELADVDNGELTDIVNRVIDELDGVDGSSAIVDDLRVRKMVLADEADGQLDADALTFQALLDEGLSETDVEKIASHERADEVAAMHPDLAVAVANDRVSFPYEPEKDAVGDAISRGLSPEESGIDPIYFPPEYREAAAELDAEVRAWEKSTDRPIEPWRREQFRRQLMGQHFTDDDGVNEVRGTIAAGDYFGDSEWKGRQLGEIYEDGLTDSPQSRFPEHSKLSAQALNEISVEVSDDPTSGTAFFNRLGPESIALLPKVVLNERGSTDREIDTIDNFSESLGRSSRGEGDGRLKFTGDAIFGSQTVVEESTLLLDKGDFSDEFVVSASASFLETDWVPVYDYPSDDTEGMESSAISERYGSDPRDVVMRKAVESGVVSEVVIELSRSENGLDVIFDPGKSFTTDDSERGSGAPVTEFLESAGADKQAASLILVGGAESPHDFSDFGVAAGVEAVMAQHVTIMYDEEYLAEHGIDPGDSGRLSQEEMAALGFGPDDWQKLTGKVHELGYGGFVATANDNLMFEAVENDLQVQMRIERDLPTLLDESGNVDEVKVRAYAAQLEADGDGGFVGDESALLTLVGDIEKNGVTGPSGNFDRFSYVSGALHERAFQANRRVRQRLDDDAEAKNQYLQAGASAASAVVVATAAAAVPVSLPGAAVVGVDIAASTGISFFFPEFWESGRVLEITEEEVEKARNQGQEIRMRARVSYLEASGETVKLSTSKDVDVEVSVEGGELTIVDSETGELWRPEEGETIYWDGGGVLTDVAHELDSQYDRGSLAGRNDVSGDVEYSSEGVDQNDIGAVESWLNF